MGGLQRQQKQAVVVFFVLIAAWLTTIITVEVVQSFHYTR